MADGKIADLQGFSKNQSLPSSRAIQKTIRQKPIRQEIIPYVDSRRAES
jgi:hypothetical protein